MNTIEAKRGFTTGILIVHATIYSYGQNNCQKNRIHGTWKSIGGVGGYENVIDNVEFKKDNSYSQRPQNTNAVEFYQKFGFKTYERTDKDDQGKDYPLLRMILETSKNNK